MNLYFPRVFLKRISVLIVLCIVLLITSCKHSTAPDARKRAGQQEAVQGAAFQKYFGPVDHDILKVIPARINEVNASDPVMIPYQEVISYEASVTQISEIDTSVLRIITPGTDNVPEVRIYTLPELTTSDLKHIVSQVEYEIQYSDTVFPLTYERAFQPEPVPAFPMRIKEPAGINMQYLSIEQGLNSPNINSVMQDRNGYIWFGLQDGGLCRYDGTSFTQFTELEGLFQNNVSSICEDRNGNIWAGTHWGICKYDGSIFTYGSFTMGLLFSPVNTIIESKEGEMWIGTTRGLIRYSNNTFSIFTEQMGLPSGDVRSIMEDGQQNIWIGTSAGICKFDGRSFTQFLPVKEMSVRTIIEDDQGKILFGGEGDGLFRYDGRFLTHLTLDEGFGNINTIIEDHNNQLWIGTNGNGLYRYNEGFFTHYTVNEGLSSNTILSIIEDNTRNIWLSTLGGGVMKIQQNSFSFLPRVQNIGSGEVSSIICDTSGNIWYSILGQGIVNYDGRSFHLLSENEGLYRNYISTIYEDRSGNIWFGNNYDGVQKYDGKKFTHFHEKDYHKGLSGPGQINSINEDREGNIWLGTLGEGLKKFDGTSITNFHGVGYRELEKILCILPDYNDNIWFGIAGGSIRLFRYDGDSLAGFMHYSNYPDIKMITSIFEDSDRNLWIGSDGGGLIRYDGNSILRLTEEDGLSHNYISSIIEDGYGNIWAGTQRGLSLVSKEDENNYRVTSLGVGSGLKNLSFNLNSVCLDLQDRLWWGTGNVVTSLDLDRFYQIKSLQPNVKLNTIRINQDFIDFRTVLYKRNHEGVENRIKFSRVASINNYPLDLELPHDLNHLTFSFTATEWSAPQAVKYRYMLAGLDEQWSPLSTRNTADYRNIPPGKYNFRVMASSSSNLWSEPFEYSFIIHRQWWMRWWALSVYGLILILLIRYYIRFMISKERIQAEVQIKQVEVEKMQELDQMKSRFFANISHEFRTPLTLILGPVKEMLKNSELLKERDRSLLGTMKRNAGRLQQLINQLLQLSSLETGNLKLEVSEGDLTGFVRTIILSFLSLAESKEIHFEYDLEESPDLLFYDKDKLDKIVSNLVSNALKFTPPGESVKVTLQYSQNDESSNGIHAVIKVADTGMGMNEEELDKIFNRFYQVGNSDSRDHEGSGIGLALVKELVDLYRGEIKVESEPSKGSVFSVKFPASMDYFQEKEILTVAQENTDVEIQGAAFGLSKESADLVINEDEEHRDDSDKPVLLIVEDNADLRTYLSSNLVDHYQVLEAKDGRDGLSKALECIPDLVISDLMMPGMDGMEMCNKLKSDTRTSHIPLIMLTAKADRDSKIGGLEKGADDYLLKPFDPEELQIRVRNLVEQRRRLREKYREEFLVDTHDLQIAAPEDAFLSRVVDCVNKHLPDLEFNVDRLGREIGLSRTQTYRKILAVTGQTPRELIKNTRLKLAARMFREGHNNVSRVMYAVGFNSSAYFAQNFRTLFGMNPSQYIKQHTHTAN